MRRRGDLWDKQSGGVRGESFSSPRLGGVEPPPSTQVPRMRNSNKELRKETPNTTSKSHNIPEILNTTHIRKIKY